MNHVKNRKLYRRAQLCHICGHDVLANLFLRAAYGFTPAPTDKN